MPQRRYDWARKGRSQRKDSFGFFLADWTDSGCIEAGSIVAEQAATFSAAKPGTTLSSAVKIDSHELSPLLRPADRWIWDLTQESGWFNWSIAWPDRLPQQGKIW